MRDITKLSGYQRSNVKRRLEQSNYYLASGTFPLQNAIYDKKTAIFTDETQSTDITSSYKENNGKMLVSSAVKFNSTMNETDVRCAIIASSFPQFSIFPDFVFLKVVDDTLIQPKVEEWNYKTLKHVAGQGPIYVRSNTRSELCEKQSDASIYDEEESCDSTEEDEHEDKILRRIFIL